MLILYCKGSMALNEIQILTLKTLCVKLSTECRMEYYALTKSEPGKYLSQEEIELKKNYLIKQAELCEELCDSLDEEKHQAKIVKIKYA